REAAEAQEILFGDGAKDIPTLVGAEEDSQQHAEHLHEDPVYLQQRTDTAAKEQTAQEHPEAESDSREGGCCETQCAGLTDFRVGLAADQGPVALPDAFPLAGGAVQSLDDAFAQK